jgi:hypothetical protein
MLPIPPHLEVAEAYWLVGVDSRLEAADFNLPLDAVDALKVGEQKPPPQASSGTLHLSAYHCSPYVFSGDLREGFIQPIEDMLVGKCAGPYLAMFLSSILTCKEHIFFGACQVIVELLSLPSDASVCLRITD